MAYLGQGSILLFKLFAELLHLPYACSKPPTLLDDVLLAI